MAQRSKQLYPCGNRHRAFTLMELLVVMAIIVVIAAAAMPVVRAVMGAGSSERASNMISAMLGRAHQTAISDQRACGVFFFNDPVADRSTAVLVRQEGSDDPDPQFDEYKGWSSNNILYYQSPNGLIQGPSYAFAMSSLSNETKWGSLPVPKPTLCKFKCIENNASSVGSNPGGPLLSSTTTNGVPSPWYYVNARFLEPYPGVEYERFPLGVDCMVVNDPLGIPVATASGKYNRYTREGVILYDPVGHMAAYQWALHSNGQLALLLNPANPTTGSTAGLPYDFDFYDTPKTALMPILWSSPGVAIFVRDGLFAGVTQTSSGAVTDTTVLTPFNASMADWMFASGVQYQNASGATVTGPFIPSQIPPTGWNLNYAALQETWIDFNASILLVNHHSGRAVKGF